MFPVALQLFSVRDDLEKDFKGTLKKVKELGYDGVEFAGLNGMNTGEVKQMLEELELIPLSAHVPFDAMMADPQNVLADYAKIGCKYVAIPYLTEEYRPGAEKFGEVLDGARILGKVANELGLTLLYHNHDFEFVMIDGEYALDVIYREIHPELLQTQIDTCWVNVAGENPASYIRKYTGRAPVVHLKDFYMPGKKPDKMYELIGIEEEDSVKKEENIFEFRPVGYGMQDFKAILSAAKDAGSLWVVVEQDMPSMGKTALECAEMSIKYVKSIDE